MKFTRRDFIKTSAAAGAAAGISDFAAPATADWLQQNSLAWKRSANGCEQIAMPGNADWTVCLQRIRELDPSIHAWVKCSPKGPQRTDRFPKFPLVLKTSSKTQNMATEYGSPLYKGRLGTKDAAIIRDMRSRGAILLGRL